MRVIAPREARASALVADERARLFRRTEGQCSRYSIVHVHLVHEGEHFGSLVMRQRPLIHTEHIGHLFHGEAEFVRVDELRDQRDVLAREPVV